MRILKLKFNDEKAIFRTPVKVKPSIKSDCYYFESDSGLAANLILKCLRKAYIMPAIIVIAMSAQVSFKPLKYM